MMRLKDLFLRTLNLPLAPLGLSVLPTWRTQWQTAGETFLLWGRTYPCFYHRHNCGWPPARTSVRSVELALADAWLGKEWPESIVEIGAVSPYYWPHRIDRIIDPFDKHQLVTDRRSLFDVDLRGKKVLSISTFEHIGEGRHGTGEPPTAVLDAFQKLFAEAAAFLVTVPADYNPLLDELLIKQRDIPADVRMAFLCRAGTSWQQAESPTAAQLAYGQGANTLIVLERGNNLRDGK